MGAVQDHRNGLYFLERWSEQPCSTLLTTGKVIIMILVMDSLWWQSITVY